MTNRHKGSPTGVQDLSDEKTADPPEKIFAQILADLNRDHPEVRRDQIVTYIRSIDIEANLKEQVIKVAEDYLAEFSAVRKKRIKRAIKRRKEIESEALAADPKLQCVLAYLEHKIGIGKAKDKNRIHAGKLLYTKLRQFIFDRITVDDVPVGLTLFEYCARTAVILERWDDAALLIHFGANIHRRAVADGESIRSTIINKFPPAIAHGQSLSAKKRDEKAAFAKLWYKVSTLDILSGDLIDVLRSATRKLEARHVRAYVMCRQNQALADNIGSADAGRSHEAHTLLFSTAIRDVEVEDEEMEKLTNLSLNELISLYLQKGANPYYRNSNNVSLFAVIATISVELKQFDLVSLFFDAVENPIALFVDNPDPVSYILVNACLRSETEILAKMLRLGCDKDGLYSYMSVQGREQIRVHQCQTLLYIAVRYGNIKTAQFLLEQCQVDVNKTCVEAEMQEIIVVGYGALIPNYSPPRRVEYEGRTALHMACQVGNHELIQLLLDHGADTTKKDEEGKKPMDMLSFFAFAMRKLLRHSK